MNPGTIALLTDYGINDPYAGMMKGVILSIAPQARIVDLTHGIEPGNIVKAAFFLQQSVRFFPMGTVYLCVVDPGVGTRRKAVAVRISSCFFVGPDNGIFGPVLEEAKGAEVRVISNPSYRLSKETSATFHGRDIFAPAAAHLCMDPDCFRNLGPRINSAVPLELPEARKGRGKLSGKIWYFDRFGNAVTNIRWTELTEKQWKKAKVWLKGMKEVPVAKTYGPKGEECISLFNSMGMLEIAVPGGSAREKAALTEEDEILVRF